MPQPFLCNVCSATEHTNIIRGYVANNKGFTLIELLVVIAIIGTLSTIGFIALTSSQEGAKDATKVAEVQSIRSALQINYSVSGKYPNVAGTTTPSKHCEQASVANGLNKLLEGKIQNIDWTKYTYCASTGDNDGTKSEATWAVIGATEKLSSDHAVLKGDVDEGICADTSGTDGVFCLLVGAPPAGGLPTLANI